MSAPQRGPTAFLAPMRIELASLLRLLSLEEQRLGDLVVHAGALGGRRVLATMTGIGVPAARDTARRLIEATPLDHVIVVGVAGGVEPGLRIGDVVVPETVIAGWSGEAHHPAPLGSVPPRGRLLTTETLETGPEVLATRLAEGITAVDMETAAVAEVCDRNGVPWSVVRSISDRLSDNLLDSSFSTMVKPDGTPRAGATARFIAANPGSLLRLSRLARDAKAAAAAAARAAIAACGEPVG